MRVRYRETGRTDHVELHVDEHEGLVLVGWGDPCFREEDAMPDPDKPYFIGPDTFEDWQLIEASFDERRRLREAGFRID